MIVSLGQLQQLIGDFNEIGLAEFRRILGEMTEKPAHDIDSFLVGQLLDFNGNRNMRAAIASVLANREDESLIEPFGAVIEKETEVGLCKECILGLERIGTPEALQKLQYLARSKPNPTIASILRNEIEKMNQSEPVQYYIEQLKLGNHNPRLSKNASRVLCRIGPPDVVDTLFKLFPDMDEMAQVEAMRVVTQLGKSVHLPIIHQLIRENLEGLSKREVLMDILALDQEEDKSTRVNRFLNEASKFFSDSKLAKFEAFREKLFENPAACEPLLDNLKTGDYTYGLDFFLESVYFIQRNQMAHARKIHELTSKLTHARVTRYIHFLSEAALAMGRTTHQALDQEELRLKSVELCHDLLRILRGDVIKSTLFALGHFLRPQDQELMTRLVKISHVEGMSRLLERLRKLEDAGFMDFYLDVAQNHEFIEVQDKALQALCVIQGIEPRIHEMLADENPNVLQMGIRLTGETANPAFIPKLQNLLEHRSNIVRAETVKALGRIGEESCLDLVLGAMKEAKSTALVHTCLESISQIHTPKAITALKDFASQTRVPESSLYAVQLLVGYYNHWRNPMPDELLEMVMPLLKSWLTSNQANFRNDAYALGSRIFCWRLDIYQQLRDMYKEAISVLRKQVNWNKEEMAKAEEGLKKLNNLYFQVKDFQEFLKTLKFKLQQPIQPNPQARTLAFERILNHLNNSDFPIEPSHEAMIAQFVTTQLEQTDLSWREEDLLYRIAYFAQDKTMTEALKSRLLSVPAQAKNSLLDALVKNGIGLEAFSPPEKIHSVLIVEGSAFFANRLKSILEKGGFAVETATEIDPALKMIVEKSHDLVISEIQIKEKGDGLDMLTAGLKRAQRPFHVIISTNIRDDSVMGRVQALNPKAVLYKPYKFEDILQYLS
ncbi:MAG: HEAT repeat domain-containing protein [Acidobacteria bacterium]|nr:HEAT repeat domain-containing protein [Acidobacteriota bacterium]MCB9396292.1 HEAT repeat domain-containing protein [Acidobacteriota bacterium]